MSQNHRLTALLAGDTDLTELDVTNNPDITWLTIDDDVTCIGLVCQNRQTPLGSVIGTNSQQAIQATKAVEQKDQHLQFPPRDGKTQLQQKLQREFLEPNMPAHRSRLH
ncbi:hypothetical protein L1285_08015 [Pseudoalteromonas sp. DL2-H2.2]|uniref:hypothetical protein n=1 Tax=Pseudoalteromonas sp. DL2-H2.2 TaxID=2908889 RepID=UPI001F2ED295|nr:hypothetical protein [Pseudoalteromonas sp. DL2-H2.2]MCF2908268.1 hypothetical protein [Pseudoalteromonas sp. DL2-H2.2]